VECLPGLSGGAPRAETRVLGRHSHVASAVALTEPTGAPPGGGSWAVCVATNGGRDVTRR
jgi:hypothetical protein